MLMPDRFSGDGFDLDIRVVSPDSPQPVQVADTERCTPRYGGYTCRACSTVGCLTIVYGGGVTPEGCCFAGTRTQRVPGCG